MIQNIDINQDVEQDETHVLDASHALENALFKEKGLALKDSLALKKGMAHDIEDAFAIDIDNEPDIQFSNSPGHQTTHKPAFIFVLISIFKSTSVHIVLVFLVVYFSNVGDNVIQSHSEPTSSPIKASLYFPPAPIAEIPKTEDAIELVNEELIIEETVIEETAIQEANIEEIMEEITKPTDQISDNIEQAVPNQAQQTLETESGISQSSQTPPPMTSSSLPQSSSSMERRNMALSSHLNQLQETHVQQMSQNALRNKDQIFYERQTQGLSYDPQNYDPKNYGPKNLDSQSFENGAGDALESSNLEYMEQMHLTGIEMSAQHQSQLKPTTVDCSSTSGKVAQTMSFFMGGRVSCTPKPEFQKYIDARLNKNQK